MTKSKVSKPHNVVNGRWRLGRRLGSGSFGDIYNVYDKVTSKYLAAKVENPSSKFPQLRLEYKVYKSMATYNGFPRVYWIGSAILAVNNGKPQKMDVLIMDKLGPSLEELFVSCNRKFGVKTVCMTGIQLVNRIESLHKEGFLHRDIKPDNFLVGAGDRHSKDGSVIHMIDMGLTKRFRNESGQHIPIREGKRLTGTPRYASINTHNGMEQSRRDDVESLAYVLLYLLKGRLPWQGMKGSTKLEKYEQIKRKKIGTPIETLCEDLPHEFENLLTYVRELKFTDVPDYRWMKKLLQLCCQRVSGKIDWRFLWQNPLAATSELKAKKRYNDKTVLPKKRPQRNHPALPPPKRPCNNWRRNSAERDFFQRDENIQKEKTNVEKLQVAALNTKQKKMLQLQKTFGGDTVKMLEAYCELEYELQNQKHREAVLTVELAEYKKKLYKLEADRNEYKKKCCEFANVNAQLQDELRAAQRQMRKMGALHKTYFRSMPTLSPFDLNATGQR